MPKKKSSFGGAVPVSKRALEQRISRTLAKQKEKLKKCRNPRYWDSLGKYYIVSLNENRIVQTQIDLEALALELGSLQPWERLAE